MSVGGKLTGGFGAEGMTGGQAIARQLDELAKGGAKSWRSKAVELTSTGAGQRALIEAGIDLNNPRTRNTVLGWLSDEEATTTPKYRRAVEQAYEARRRPAVARDLKRRLGRGGQGTRVEVNPLNQSRVAEHRQRPLTQRKVTIRETQWNVLIDAWDAGDIDGMQAIWEGIAEEGIGTDHEAYHWVSSISFGA